jgi:hypothetical protein
MKWKKQNSLFKILFLAAPFIYFSGHAQNSTDKKSISLGIAYYASSNNAVYLMANAKTKIEGKFQPVKGVAVSIYLDKDSTGYLIGKSLTDAHGLVKAVIPPALQAAWNAAPSHTFFAKTEEGALYEAASAEAKITKSKIVLDTVSSGEVHTVIISALAFNGNEWVPIPGLELKAGVGRSVGSILAFTDKDAFTTDSTGKVSIEITKTNFPGDDKGNMLLVAKMEENDQYGSLLVEKKVPWGLAVQTDDNFFSQRALWATRFRTPIWLLVMAYSIVAGVWGTIIYLVMQLIKIKKLGKQVEN